MTEFTLSHTAPILAIDLGKFNSMCCFFDPDTGNARFQTAATDRSDRQTLPAAQDVQRVVFEACGSSGWLADLCEELQIETLVGMTNAWLEEQGLIRLKALWAELTPIRRTA